MLQCTPPAPSMNTSPWQCQPSFGHRRSGHQARAATAVHAGGRSAAHQRPLGYAEGRNLHRERMCQRPTAHSLLGTECVLIGCGCVLNSCRQRPKTSTGVPTAFFASYHRPVSGVAAQTLGAMRLGLSGDIRPPSSPVSMSPGHRNSKRSSLHHSAAEFKRLSTPQPPAPPEEAIKPLTVKHVFSSGGFADLVARWDCVVQSL